MLVCLFMVIVLLLLVIDSVGVGCVGCGCWMLWRLVCVVGFSLMFMIS